MNEFGKSMEFVKALVAQDALVETTDFAHHREQVLGRIARAKRRERLARWVTFSFAGITLAGLAFLGATNLDAIGHANQWPEWLQNLAAGCFFLLPVAALLLGAVYLLQHYRELQQARRAAYRQTLAELELQLAELKRLLPEQRDAEGDKPERPNGFTLVELLVVIGILSLLAALIAPSLTSAKARARRTVCRNNLGQLGVALAMYVGEFHSYPGTVISPIRPPAAGPGSSSDPDPTLWDSQLNPYLAFGAAAFSCPDHLLSRYETAYGANYRANYNYGYNALGSGLGAPPQNLGLGRIVVAGAVPGVGIRAASFPVLESKVIAPAEMIAIADREGGDEFCTPVVTPGSLRVRGDDDPGHNHQGGANAVFCDAHIEFGLQQRWKEQTEVVRCRWNNDHQAHRETW